MSGEKSRRFILLAASDALVLCALTLFADQLWDGITLYAAALYSLAVGMAAKALGDLLYYLTSPSRRSWLYADDYLFNEFLVHMRFIFPLACLQTWLANTALLAYPLLRRICLSPLAGVAAWAADRWAAEAAEDRRSRPLGGGAARLTHK